jgi:hypothetical protein
MPRTTATGERRQPNLETGIIIHSSSENSNINSGHRRAHTHARASSPSWVWHPHTYLRFGLFLPFPLSGIGRRLAVDMDESCSFSRSTGGGERFLNAAGTIQRRGERGEREMAKLETRGRLRTPSANFCFFIPVNYIPPRRLAQDYA